MCSQSRSVSSWPTYLTMAMIGWVCTRLSPWWSLSSVGQISSCRRCPRSSSLRSTFRSSLRRETHSGRSVYSCCFWKSWFHHCISNLLLRKIHFIPNKLLFEGFKRPLFMLAVQIKGDMWLFEWQNLLIMMSKAISCTA